MREILRPKNFATVNVETLTDYLSRIQPYLLNWPIDPLENWMYRHFDYMYDEYIWLGYRNMKFARQEFISSKIIRDISSHAIDAIDRLGSQIISKPGLRKTWLQNYMLENITWPSPIIVLENNGSIVDPRGTVYAKPFHLLEGNLRLAYFRKLFSVGMITEKTIHDVWIITGVP